MCVEKVLVVEKEVFREVSLFSYKWGTSRQYPQFLYDVVF